MAPSTYIHTAPAWGGMDVFIIAGGTSVDPAVVQRLNGRENSKTIVINSSYQIAPWADVLYFADDRWFKREMAERPELVKAFKGQILTTSIHSRDPRIEKLKKIAPTKAQPLSLDPEVLAIERTSVHACLNICYHAKPRRVILLGVDNKDGPEGRIHHHAEYPWPRRQSTWDVKQKQLRLTVDPMHAAGIEILNASPISDLEWWHKIDLAEWLNEESKNA